jgi:hypothetical protein
LLEASPNFDDNKVGCKIREILAKKKKKKKEKKKKKKDNKKVRLSE